MKSIYSGLPAGFGRSRIPVWSAALLHSGLALNLLVATSAQAQLPDLEPVGVTWSGQPAAGQSLAVAMTVTNLGSASASGYWYDTWVLSSNSTLSGAVPNGTFNTLYFNYSH